MERHSFFKPSISNRLFFFCLFMVLVFGANIAAIISSFDNIKGLSNTIVTKNVGRIIQNTQLTRDLSKVLNETTDLINTFYDHDEILAEKSKILIGRINEIRNKDIETVLRQNLDIFQDSLILLFVQCTAINNRYTTIVEIDRVLHTLLTNLENNISQKIINLVLAGESSRVYEQIGALIPSYRESLLQLTLAFGGLQPTFENQSDSQKITEILGKLHLRLRTLLASDSEVSEYGQSLLDQITVYQINIGDFLVERKELNSRLVVLDRAKEETIATMKKIDKRAINATQRMKNEITEITSSSVDRVLVISGGIAVILGLSAWFFFHQHIRKPMEQIRRCIVSVSEGDLDTRIKLTRSDEWNVIENALNKMIHDLRDSYVKLQTSNEELVRMYGETEKNLVVLEREVCQRKIAEDALLASEDQYRRFFEDDLSGAFIARADGQLLVCNPSFVHMFGFPSMEYTAQLTIQKIFLSVEASESFFSQLKIHKRLEYYESEFVRFDGTILYAVGNVTGTFNDSGELLEMKGYLVDETVRKHAEEKTQRLEQQLQNAQKMEAIGTLAGGVAHDLNNILSGIVSYPDLLLRQIGNSSPLLKPLQTIKDSGVKASAIVQDLLTLARRGVTVKETINLNTLVSEYLGSAEFKQLMDRNPNITIIPHLAEDLLPISGSPVHLAKTLMNLVGNSAESMPHGGEILLVTDNKYVDSPLEGYDTIAEGDYAVIIIQDQGHGIEPEDINKIFEPFYTKKKMGNSGTGLGMAVVWGTIKDHFGYITTESYIEKGTTFTLYFPVSAHTPSKDQQDTDFEDIQGNQEKILVVDDVLEQREIASAILTNLEYQVYTVASGEEAVALSVKTCFDLLILDMILGEGIDGLDTYKQISERHPHQRAIITSGYSETDRVSEALRLGAGQYIKKPYMMHKLGLAVKQELQKKASC